MLLRRLADGRRCIARETGARCGGLPRYGPAMDDEDGFFGERAAARYDETSDMFEPGAVDATTGVLAGLAAGGLAREPDTVAVLFLRRRYTATAREQLRL